MLGHLAKISILKSLNSPLTFDHKRTKRLHFKKQSQNVVIIMCHFTDKLFWLFRLYLQND